MSLFRLLLAASVIAFAALPAYAQYYDSRSDSADRMDRLERDLQLLQRQVARGDVAPVSGGETYQDVHPVGSSALARTSQLEEDIRRLHGDIEKLQHDNDELKSQIERLSKDYDYRLKAIEDKQAAAAVTPAPVAAIVQATPETASGEEVPDVPEKPVTKPTRAAAREQYNAAFHLLNQAQYAQAGDAFESFVQQYPKDPLTANAYYWLGETYYVRGNYTKAADSFRQGFETNPKGSKAGDNLLKLGMSLSAMKREKEACVVFKQIGVKYAGSTASKKAEQESARLNCQ